MEKRRRLKIYVYSAQWRTVDDLAWCALCHEIKPLFWSDGKLFCYQVKFYPKGARLVVLDSCIADMPIYNKTIKVEGSANIPSTILPVVKSSAIAEKVLKQALNLLKDEKKPKGEEKTTT